MSTLSIGDFARATHLSIKTLRHYHEEQLLEPAEISPQSGYRRYGVEQIPVAQVIRRFRDLGMPVAEIRAVLRAPDLSVRNVLISEHLARLEAELGRTQAAVAQLRDLLERPAVAAEISLRHVPGFAAAAISAEVSSAEISGWLAGALGELFATVESQVGVGTAGAAGGIYADGLFQQERGAATVFLPISGELGAVGRVVAIDVPAVDLAVITHHGPEAGTDRAYGELGAYVARHALGIDGPIREMYPVGRHETGDSSQWRTEIGWPVFPTRAER